MTRLAKLLHELPESSRKLNKTFRSAIIFLF